MAKKYIICGESGLVAYSSNLLDWTNIQGLGSTSFNVVVRGSDRFVVAGNDKLVVLHDDDTTDIVNGVSGSKACYSGGYFWLVSGASTLKRSQDGLTWNDIDIGSANALVGITSQADNILAIANTGDFYYSINGGSTFSAGSVNIGGYPILCSSYNGRFYVAYEGGFRYTESLSSPSFISCGIYAETPSLIGSPSALVAFGAYDGWWRSDNNGTSWSKALDDNGALMDDGIYDGSYIFTVGYDSLYQLDLSANSSQLVTTPYPNTRILGILSYQDSLVQVDAPVIDYASGVYYSGILVTPTCATSGASIYYTIDGSTPSFSSTEVSGPIQVGPSKNTLTLKCIAIKSGMTDSYISSNIYDFKCENPYASVDGGIYNYAISVALNCATSGAVIRYTLSGENPTSASSAYSQEIDIDTTSEIAMKFVAMADNYQDSDVQSVYYNSIFHNYIDYNDVENWNDLSRWNVTGYSGIGLPGDNTILSMASTSPVLRLVAPVLDTFMVSFDVEAYNTTSMYFTEPGATVSASGNYILADSKFSVSFIDIEDSVINYIVAEADQPAAVGLFYVGTNYRVFIGKIKNKVALKIYSIDTNSIVTDTYYDMSASGGNMDFVIMLGQTNSKIGPMSFVTGATEVQVASFMFRGMADFWTDTGTDNGGTDNGGTDNGNTNNGGGVDITTATIPNSPSTVFYNFYKSKFENY